MTPSNTENTTSIRTKILKCSVCLQQRMELYMKNPIVECACCKLVFHAKCYGISETSPRVIQFMCHLCDHQVNLLLVANKANTYSRNDRGEIEFHAGDFQKKDRFLIRDFITARKHDIKRYLLPMCMICGEGSVQKLYSKLATHDGFVHTACALSLKENKQIITHYIPSKDSFMYSLLPPVQNSSLSKTNIHKGNKQCFKVRCSFGECPNIVEPKYVPGEKGKIVLINNDSPLLKERIKYICAEHNTKNIHEKDCSKKYNYIWWLKKELRKEYKEYYHFERYSNYTYQKENCENMWNLLEDNFDLIHRRNVQSINDMVSMLETIIPVTLNYKKEKLIAYLQGNVIVNVFRVGFSRVVVNKMIEKITPENIKIIKRHRVLDQKDKSNTLKGFLMNISGPDNKQDFIVKKLIEDTFYKIKLTGYETIPRNKTTNEEWNLDELVNEFKLFSGRKELIFDLLDKKHIECEPQSIMPNESRQGQSDSKHNVNGKSKEPHINQVRDFILNTFNNAFIIHNILAKKNRVTLEKLLKEYSKFIKRLNNKKTRKFTDETISDTSLLSKKMGNALTTNKGNKIEKLLNYIQRGQENYEFYKDSEDVVVQKRKKLKLLMLDKSRNNSIEGNLETVENQIEQFEEKENCCICLKESFTDDNQIVFCEFCDISVHQGCYGIDILPPGEWYCSRCNYYLFVKPDDVFTDNLNCVICGIDTGAMKPTYLKGVWCHSICAFWTPETFVGSSCTLEPVFGFESINSIYASCVVCERTGPGCQPCSNSNCYNYMHISCAQIDGGSLVESSERSHFSYDQYCPSCVRKRIKILNQDNESCEQLAPNEVKKLIGKTGIKFTEITTKKQKQRSAVLISFMDKHNLYTAMSEIDSCSLCKLQLEEPIIKCWPCGLSVHLSCYGENEEYVANYKLTVAENEKKKEISNTNNHQEIQTLEANVEQHAKKEAATNTSNVFLRGELLFWICTECLVAPDKARQKLMKLTYQSIKEKKQPVVEREQASLKSPEGMERTIPKNEPFIGTRVNLRSSNVIGESTPQPSISEQVREVMMKFTGRTNKPFGRVEKYFMKSVGNVCECCRLSGGIMKPLENTKFMKWVHIYCANTSFEFSRLYDDDITKRTFYRINHLSTNFKSENGNYKSILTRHRCAGCQGEPNRFVIRTCPLNGCEEVYYHGNCMQFSTDLNIYRHSYNTTHLCRIHTVYHFKYFTHRHMLKNDSKFNLRNCEICFRPALRKVKHCVKCGLTMHAKCMYLDNRLEREPIMEDWVCDVCCLEEERQQEITCLYCKNNIKGLVKLDSFSKIFVHPICYKIALRDYCYNNTYFSQRSSNNTIAKVHPMNCLLCENQDGNIYKCTEPGCVNSAHLTCAHSSPYNKVLNILEFNFLSPEHPAIKENESARNISFLNYMVKKPLGTYLYENTYYKFKCSTHIKEWDVIGLFNVKCHSCGFGRIEKGNPLILCLTCGKFYHENCYRSLKNWNEKNGYTFKCDGCFEKENKLRVQEANCVLCFEEVNKIRERGGVMRLQLLDVNIGGATLTSDFKDKISEEQQLKQKWCYVCDYCERSFSEMEMDLRDKSNYIDRVNKCSLCNEVSENSLGRGCEVEIIESEIGGENLCGKWSHFSCEKKYFYKTKEKYIKNALMERNSMPFDFCCKEHYKNTFSDCYCAAYIDETSLYRGVPGEGRTNLECRTCRDRFHPLCIGISIEEVNNAFEQGFKCIRCLLMFNA